jgi:hypothetical protein
MDFAFIFQFLAGLHPVVPVILLAFGSLVVVGQFIVLATPGKSDDAVVARLKALPLVGNLLLALAKFAPKWPGDPAA